jgi:hypothetical protein
MDAISLITTENVNYGQTGYVIPHGSDVTVRFIPHGTTGGFRMEKKDLYFGRETYYNNPKNFCNSNERL